MLDPLIILGIGLIIVLGLILVFRTNAFIALIAAAFTVSFLAAGETGPLLWETKIVRVTEAFGVMTGKVAILIVMGAIIGECMMESGAAQRIIITICRIFGEKRVPAALLSAGFVLSIPVFYDTTFYLLVPLARSFYKKVRKNYVLLLTAIGAGATLTHTLVPPTPGPLITGQELGLSVGSVMLTGFIVAFLLAPVSLLGCYFVNWYLPQPRISDELNEIDSTTKEEQQAAEAALPSFFMSIIPIILPVILITCNSTLKMLESLENGYTLITPVRNLVLILGNANIALAVSAFIASIIMLRQRGFTLKQFSHRIEQSIANAGMIVLITAAGGAFGAMLRDANVGERICELFSTESGFTGATIILLAFCIASLIKTAQGSSTTAMITTAGIIGSFALDPEMLGFHPAYIATTIGLGSMVTGWMNDSGFWVFCRMGGINEIDAMKTWSVLLALMGVAGLGFVLVLVRILPLA